MSLRIVVCVCAVLAFAVGVAVADVPLLINYQGALNDDTGNPVPDGDYQITFSIYTVAEGGTFIWSSGEQTVAVSGGQINYQLGFNETLPDDLFSSGSVSCWDGVGFLRGSAAADSRQNADLLMMLQLRRRYVTPAKAGVHDACIARGLERL